MIANPDLKILLECNSLLTANPLVAKLGSFLCTDPLARGFPVFSALTALWFKTNDRERRARMAVGMLGVCLALAMSISVQMLFHSHLHPSIDPSISLNGRDLGVIPLGYDRQYSFPSDTTNLFMALSTVVFLESRALGYISMAWFLLITGFIRVGLGCHYPSDIAGGIVLGVGSVLLITRLKPLMKWVEGRFEQSAARIYVVHAVFVFFLADAYMIFPGIIGILKTTKMVVSMSAK